MPVWLGLLVLMAVVALTIAIVWGVRQFGQYTERNRVENRAMVREFCARMERAARDINASTSLLHQSFNDSLATMVRIRKAGGNLAPNDEPSPAPFTSEENDTDDPIHRVSSGTDG